MKTSPRPASVIDTDEKGTPLLQTKRSAARVTKRHSDPGARKSSSTHETKTKPTSKPEPTLIVGESRCHGPIHNLVTTYDGNNTLTIFSTGKDHSDETNAVEGACFRKIFLTDETEILNPDAAYERQRYVKLVILISHQDEIFENPTIFVEQRVHAKDTQKQQTVAHELMFGTNVQLGVEYVFPGCGDEDAAFGKRDLFVRFQSLDTTVFKQYIQHARYYGYDRHECVQLNKEKLSTGVHYNVAPVDDASQASPFRGHLESSDLQSLLKSKTGNPQPKGYFTEHGIELIKLRFCGYGRWTRGREHGGDLIIHFVYSPSPIPPTKH
ncbi:hypothetical protein BJX68DRAFT_65224 [Aspergillus pseudodeflectus]|uniref:Uncharacterized protein n=1 Tax=Aspergillus pseudodeflectus TaxID=176178 RepID=A0ABR4KH86_9EURO